MGHIGQERSMEEILSSIKRVIQEGADGMRGRREDARPLPRALSDDQDRDDRDDAGDAAWRTDEDDGAVLELTVPADGESGGDGAEDGADASEPVAAGAPAATSTAADLDLAPFVPARRFIDAEPELSSAAVPPPSEEARDGAVSAHRPHGDGAAGSERARRADEGERAAQPLLSSAAAAAGRQSFAALSRVVVRDAGGEVTLDAMVREMLRPMLAEWLDANLPDIVERQVAAEVRRLSEDRSG